MPSLAREVEYCLKFVHIRTAFPEICISFAGLNQTADDVDEIERNKSLDVFVSYRRSNGSQLAR